MKLKTSLVICAAMACLLGCASPNEMRAKGPSLEVRSSHPAKQVADCIANRWENSGWLGTTVPITMRQTQEGFTVSFYNAAWGKTDLLADVNDVEGGSITRYYAGSGATESAAKAVRECQ